eukprot:1746795-Pleurochrysis_carterae.AAC.1
MVLTAAERQTPMSMVSHRDGTCVAINAFAKRHGTIRVFQHCFTGSYALDTYKLSTTLKQRGKYRPSVGSAKPAFGTKLTCHSSEFAIRVQPPLALGALENGCCHVHPARDLRRLRPLPWS